MRLFSNLFLICLIAVSQVSFADDQCDVNSSYENILDCVVSEGAQDNDITEDDTSVSGMEKANTETASVVNTNAR